MNFQVSYLLLGIIAILIVLFSRYIALFLANFLLSKKHQANIRELGILTWAGLRGGISIALALSLPNGEIRDAILLVTYVVVVFSIIGQSLSIEKLVAALKKQ